MGQSRSQQKRQHRHNIETMGIQHANQQELNTQQFGHQQELNVQQYGHQQGLNTQQYGHQQGLNEQQFGHQQALNEQGQQLQVQTWKETNAAAQARELNKAGLNVGLMYGGLGS